MDTLGMAILQTLLAAIVHMVQACGLVLVALLRFVGGLIGEQPPVVNVAVALGCAWFAVAALCALVVARMAR
jgi:hypothetical protein